MGQIKNDKKRIILLCLLSAGLAGIIFIVFSIIQGVTPFGTNSVLRNDAILQYAPFLADYMAKIKSGSLSLWSWTLGGGINEYGLVAYYLLSPFNLLALPFNSSNIDIAFWLIILVKTMFIGLTAGYYFQKKADGNSILAIAFSLLYTFSGFYICYYYNTMWLDALIALPLIALGIENIVNGKKATLYFCSLAYAIFVNFYLGYMLCIFSVMYFLYLIFAKDVTKKEDKSDEQPVLKVLFRFGAASFFAGAVCALVIIPVIYALNNSGSVSNYSFSKSLFNFFDFLSYHLSSVGVGAIETTDETAPYLMSSMMTFIAVPVFFCLKNVKLNKKIAALVFVVIFYFSFSVPQLNFFWHGFTTPHGLPYRFTFLYLFFIITLAYETVKNIKELPIWSFVPSLILIVLGLIYTKRSQFSSHFDERTIIISVVFACVYLSLLFVARLSKLNKNALFIAFSCALCAEIILSNYTAIYQSQKDISALYHMNTEVDIALKDANQDAENRFIRFELANGVYDISTFPAFYHYNGISTFSSMSDNQFSIIQMTLGNYGNYGNGYIYTNQTPIYNALFSINYVYDIANTISDDNAYYEKVKDYNGGTLYKVKYMLPMGCCINDGVEKWDPYSFVAMSVQSLLWKCTTGVDGIFLTCNPEGNVVYNNAKPVDQSDISKYIEEHPEENEYAEDNDHDHEHEHEHENEIYESTEDTTQIDLTAQNVGEILNTISNMYPFKVTGENCSFEFSFTAEHRGEYYARINSGSMQTLKVVKSNGAEKELDISKRHISDLGFFEEGETFTLVICNPDRSFEDYDQNQPYSDSIQMSVASINEEKFLEGYNQILKNGTLQVDKFEDTYIHGTVNSTIDGYMMMPMPYDLGWTAYVDGEPVELHEHESHIMMFPISVGEHEIEMSYFPQGLKEGIFVSLAAVLGLALVLLLGRVHKMKLAFEAEEAAKAENGGEAEEKTDKTENK